MTEAEATAALRSVLVTVGIQVVPIIGGAAAFAKIGSQPAGLPDRFMFGPRLEPVWVEIKIRTSKLRADQRIFLHDITRWGGRAVVLRADRGASVGTVGFIGPGRAEYIASSFVWPLDRKPNGSEVIKAINTACSLCKIAWDKQKEIEKGKTDVK